MPFVQRVVEPKFLSRRPLDSSSADNELCAVTNNTLVGALRQLASLVQGADEIFGSLAQEAQVVYRRMQALRVRVSLLEDKVDALDAKSVPVPAGDLTCFSQVKEHFHMKHVIDDQILSPANRPAHVRRLYAEATSTPLDLIKQLDRYREDGVASSTLFLCVPVVGEAKRRKTGIHLDIETRRPASLIHLRNWTEEELVSDRPLVATSPVDSALSPSLSEQAALHKLPSPEEKTASLVLRFPPQLVVVDVTGRRFERMTRFRRSLLHFDYVEEKKRRKKGKSRRRNTITGTDSKEIQRALRIEQEAHSEIEALGSDLEAHRSPTSSSTWSGGCLIHTRREPKTKRTSLPSVPVQVDVHRDPTPAALLENLYEAIPDTGAGARRLRPGSSSSLATLPSALHVAVKLREERTTDEATRSSSGNWSASSSARASLESEPIRNVTPKQEQGGGSGSDQDSAVSESTGPHPASTSSSSQSQPTGACGRPHDSSFSSQTSEGEGTLTPELQDIPFVDDETSSAYSCDTEGYYTSFHVDSGIRTLRDDVPEKSSSSRALTAENEYELYGHGSTSTTTSSAGTVVLREDLHQEESKAPPPAPPPRTSSLERRKNRDSIITVIEAGANSTDSGDATDGRDGDSGRETSSSPMEPTSPRDTQMPSPEGDYSESDLEGVERQERLRVKTTITARHIPSMCVVTPPPSDDECARLSDNACKEAPLSNPQSKPIVPSGYVSEVPKDVYAVTTLPRSAGGVPQGGDSTYVTLSSISHLIRKSPAGPSEPSPKTEWPVKQRETNYLTMEDLKRLQAKTKAEAPPVKLRAPEYVTLQQLPRLTSHNQLGKISFVKSNSLRNPSALASPDSGTSDQESVGVGRGSERSSSPLSQVSSPGSSLERRRRGARVRLDPEGRVIFSSEGTPPIRAASSTFEPGPNVREIPPSPIPPRATKSFIRPVTTSGKPQVAPESRLSPPKSLPPFTSPLWPNPKSPVSDTNRTIVAASPGPLSPRVEQRPGAYVNVQGPIIPKSPTSPLSNTLRRNDSYRLANTTLSLTSVQNSPAVISSNGQSSATPVGQYRQVSPSELVSSNSDSAFRAVSNPNVQGRRFYGPQVLVNPTLLHGNKTAKSVSPVNVANAPRTKGDETPSFYKSGNDTEIW